MTPAERRCPQCYKLRAYPREFIGAKGKPIRWCIHCRANYRGWDKKTAEERASIPRTGVPRGGERLRVTFVESSHNAKLGGIPASWSSRNTCPPSCSFYDAGCYALYGKLAFHWRNVPRDGLTWDQFCERIIDLPAGQLWRHNVAGDLPGLGEDIDEEQLQLLVYANRGRRGFTFTHKHVLENAQIVNWAVSYGFVINLSAGSLEQADKLASFGFAPVAVVLPSDAPAKLRTPEGRRVVVCPSETHGLTCAECQLCAKADRQSIVGFRAHGQSKRLVSELVRSKRTEVA